MSEQKQKQVGVGLIVFGCVALVCATVLTGLDKLGAEGWVMALGSLVAAVFGINQVQVARRKETARLDRDKINDRIK